MFGDAPAPQNERTPFRPRSPYAASKVYAYWMVRNYRNAYKLFACNGIMFNHESPRREKPFWILEEVSFPDLFLPVYQVLGDGQKKALP